MSRGASDEPQAAGNRCNVLFGASTYGVVCAQSHDAYRVEEVLPYTQEHGVEDAQVSTAPRWLAWVIAPFRSHSQLEWTPNPAAVGHICTAAIMQGMAQTTLGRAFAHDCRTHNLLLMLNCDFTYCSARVDKYPLYSMFTPPRGFLQERLGDVQAALDLHSRRAGIIRLINPIYVLLPFTACQNPRRASSWSAWATCRRRWTSRAAQRSAPAARWRRACCRGGSRWAACRGPRRPVSRRQVGRPISVHGKGPHISRTHGHRLAEGLHLLVLPLFKQVV